MRTFDILSEFRALEALLNEVDVETGEFLNSEDDIKEYVINLRLSKEQKLNNIEDLNKFFSALVFDAEGEETSKKYLNLNDEYRTILKQCS